MDESSSGSGLVVPRLAAASLVALVVLAGCSGSAETGPGEPAVESVSDAEILAVQLAKVRVPDDVGSVMVALVDPDGTATYVSAGQSPEGNAPTPDDTFRIGSITKVFTALTTLTLVDEGSADLDAPAADYVSRLDVSAEVTVRDLLQHTSGIPNFTNDPSFRCRMVDDPARAWTPEEGYALVSDDEPRFEPGARSNTPTVTTWCSASSSRK